MAIIDRNGILKRLDEGGAPIALELGCGHRKRRADAVGVDRRALPGVDLVGDVHRVLGALPDACVDRVSSSHFFEHVSDLRGQMDELGRVMTPGAPLEIVVPHFSSAYFYSDPTHVQAFGLYTLSYLARDPILRRNVPHYEEPAPFTLRQVELRFRSPKVFRVRRLLKRPIGWLVNCSTWTREFYEENLCWLVPCYELRFELVRDA
jgi:hypothetical protein